MLNIEYFLKSIAGNALSGEFSSSSKGEGYDFENIKEYEKQDNIKRINWRISAKYDKEYTNIYKLDKEPVLDIFLDIDYNFHFFEKEITDYFSIIDYFIKKFGIKHNIYYLSDKKLKKLDNLTKLPSRKKGDLKSIIQSYEFKNKNNYKLLVSDFLFIDFEDIKKLTAHYKKLFCAILPIYNKLSKENKIPLINGFYNKLFMKDFMKNYKLKLDKVSELYNEVIK